MENLIGFCMTPHTPLQRHIQCELVCTENSGADVPQCACCLCEFGVRSAVDQEFRLSDLQVTAKHCVELTEAVARNKTSCWELNLEM